MTPDTIEQQARREAEAKYPPAWGPSPGGLSVDHNHVQRRVCYETLVAERSKPQPSVEEVMREVWTWAMDARMVNAQTEPYYLNSDLRDRLTKLFAK